MYRYTGIAVHKFENAAIKFTIHVPGESILWFSMPIKESNRQLRQLLGWDKNFIVVSPPKMVLVDEFEIAA